MLARVQVTIQPAVLRALHTRRGALHVILRIEMRPCPVRGATGMNDRHLPRFEQRLERREARVQPEEPVQVDGCVRRSAWSRDGQRGSRLVVRALAVRHDHVEAIDGAALKDGDQDLSPSVGSGDRACQERWSKSEADESESAVFEKDASGNHGLYLLWNSGEPRSSATACDGRDAFSTVVRVDDERSPART